MVRPGCRKYSSSLSDLSRCQFSRGVFSTYPHRMCGMEHSSPDNRSLCCSQKSSCALFANCWLRLTLRVSQPTSLRTGGRQPGGWSGLAYFRRHTALPADISLPISEDFLNTLAAKLQSLRERARVWCVFDNTGSGAAIQNALELTQKLTQAASTATMQTRSSFRGLSDTTRYCILNTNPFGTPHPLFDRCLPGTRRAQSQDGVGHGDGHTGRRSA